MVGNENLIAKDTLSNTVVENGFCIGCGACAVGQDALYKVELNDYGLYKAVHKDSIEVSDDLIEKAEKKALSVCPFSDESKNETQLASLFLNDNKHTSAKIGKYTDLYAGHVLDESLRSKASSGGVARWIAKELKRTDKIDAVVQVHSNENSTGEVVFKYNISDNVEDIVNASTSAYYPVSMDEILNELLLTDRRYLIVGVPCFIKSVRLLCLSDPLFKSRISYTMSIFCGHFKSRAFGELIAWQQGIPPQDITKINFRGKSASHKASIKTFEVDSSETRVVAQSKDLFGTNYGLGLFKPLACDTCDDVFGETADIVIGDAWLPQYVSDYRGNSLVIVRNKEISDMIKSGSKDGSLKIDIITESDVINSQIGGFRHKTQGLKLRLALMKKTIEWVPKKRIKPARITFFYPRKRIYTLRYKISKISHEMFLTSKKMNDVDYFIKTIMPLTKKYKTALSSDPYFIFSKIKSDPVSILKKAFKKPVSILKKAFKKLKKAFKGF
jgi:coenzyme F420-reducing hydrogenase beta subunit